VLDDRNVFLWRFCKLEQDANSKKESIRAAILTSIPLRSIESANFFLFKDCISRLYRISTFVKEQ
jgi:hypothetical protein